MEERYEEFGDDQQMDFSSILRALKRRSKIAVVMFAVILLFSLAYAILAKPTYRSSATILIEQQEIPQDLVRSTVTSFADQRIQMTIQRVMTFSKLSELIKKNDLYKDLRKQEPLEQVVNKMREDIEHDMVSAEVVDPRSGRPVSATIAFTIAYNSEFAATAQSVANELTSLFLNENIRNRTEMAEEAEAFLSEEVDRLETRSQKLEKAMADFKEKNLRKLPELTNLNLNLLDRSEREYFDLGRQIQALEERKVYLESQLSQQSPQSAVIASNNAENVMSPQGRAKLLQNRYLALLATYSDKHPDVIKTKRELGKLLGDSNLQMDAELLRQQIEITQSELVNLKAKYGSQHPDVVKAEKTITQYRRQLGRVSSGGRSAVKHADNPAYIQLATALEGVSVELQHLKATRADVRAKLKELEQALLDAPNVEREYRSLAREYENTTTKYQELKAKQLEARLARSLEQERKGERFTLIEPPITPQRPIKPNRILIVILGFIVASMAAIGSVYILEKIDDSIHGANDFKQLTGTPTLAAIPYIYTREETLKQRRSGFLVLLLFLLSIAAILIVIHLFYMPLDVLWYVLLRKVS